MKLIIDIPEETLNEIKDNVLFSWSISSDIRWDVTSAIVNGTPLDDVKAEIGDLPDYMFEVYKLKSRVLYMLDNIGKESEDT